MIPKYSGIHRAGTVCKAGIRLGFYPLGPDKCSGRINLHEKPGKERGSVGVLEVLIIGIALSADAFAVTISDACAYKDESRARMMLLPIAFGLFQGLMPTLGYFLGGLFAEIIETYAGVVTLLILGIIGGNMIREGISALRANNHEEEEVCNHLTLGIIVIQAIATAIDAFAVGVSLRAQAVAIIPTALLITCTTFVCVCIALAIGRRFGLLLGDRAEVVGGVVLVLIGLRAFFF